MVERGSGGGVSLCGSSVKGTWREDSLAGNPKGCRKGSEDRHLFP